MKSQTNRINCDKLLKICQQKFDIISEKIIKEENLLKKRNNDLIKLQRKEKVFSIKKSSIEEKKFIELQKHPLVTTAILSDYVFDIENLRKSEIEFKQKVEHTSSYIINSNMNIKDLKATLLLLHLKLEGLNKLMRN